MAQKWDRHAAARRLSRRRRARRTRWKKRLSTALLLVAFGVLGIFLGLRVAGSSRLSLIWDPAKSDVSPISESGVTGGLPPLPQGLGSCSLFSLTDRAVSGYIWDSPVLVPPRDDGIFRFERIDHPTSHLIWKHPYGRTFSLPILMYHSVSRPAKNLCVTPEELRSQMEALRSAGYVAVTLETVLLYARGIPVRMPPKPVVLTFDDGYVDFIDSAVPILEEFGFRATVFVIAGRVGRPGYMSWSDVREAALAGHEIGCHSMTHMDLTGLGRISLEREIRSAREAIESEAGILPKSFCYPSGKYSDPVRSMLAEEGYLGAVTTEPGTTSTAGDPYLLRRVRVDGSAGIGTFKKQMGIGP